MNSYTLMMITEDGRTSFAHDLTFECALRNARANQKRVTSLKSWRIVDDSRFVIIAEYSK